MKRGALFLLFCACTSAGAQTLLFSLTEPVNGKVASPSSSFVLPAPGSGLYLLYDHTRSFADTAVWYEFHRNGRYQKRIPQTVEPAWSYCWKRIPFYNEGDYEVRVYDRTGTKLTTQFLTVKFDSSGSPMPDSAITTTYFAHSKILFCDSVTSAGDPVNPNTEFSSGPGGRTLYIILQNSEKPISVAEIQITIQKKSVEKDVEVAQLKQKVNPDFTFAALQYQFEKRGDYSVILKTASGIWINTATLSIIK